MSLRARLLAVLVALAALGLAVGGAASYLALRSYLFDRLDKQVVAAVPQVGHALFDRDRGGFGAGGGPPGGPDGGRGGPLQLPPGTYGERRDASGRVVGHVVFGYQAKRPSLPAQLPTSPGPDQAHLVTVGGYRVLATTTGDGTVVVAVPTGELTQTLHRLLSIEALVAALVLIGLAVLALWLVRLGLAPLERMGATAGAIAAGDFSRRVEPAEPRTEVGRLGLALNQMLTQIERAFAERRASEDKLRRFLSDASHELRTPLASIRGYAELFRIGAARKPDDVEKAMSRIEEESARMGTLVEDLLTLARLDEERGLVREEVDLSRLASDAAHDAQAAAPDREIALDAPAGALVDGDANRLRQVIGNLVRNALVHTPAGTPVELHVRREDGQVELEVRDHGPGLPTERPQELFERFWRAESGRERGKAGAGLGLAIVDGIVSAHGGTVSARNAPDGGASFRVRLPAARD